MQIDDRFSPKLALAAQPSSANFFTIAGAGLSKGLQDRENSKLREIKMNDIKAKISDDKLVGKYISHVENGGDHGSFLKENSFQTAEGISAVENFRRQKAVERLNEKKVSILQQKVNKPRVVRARRVPARKKKAVADRVVTPNASALSDYNKSLSASATVPAVSPVQTVSKFIDGKPVTITIKG